MDEFSLIDRFFKPLGGAQPGVVLGVGDDCAILEPSSGEQIVVTSDTFVDGVHFPSNSDGSRVAYRSFATSVSDIAAMGAVPKYATLALCLPHNDNSWLLRFADGLDAALQQYQVDLIGGDTTRGPLTISWTVLGVVPTGMALTRAGAKPGDGVYVSGDLGAAAYALEMLERDEETLSAPQASVIERYWRPQARCELGARLRSIAHCCIDVSDGLLADLEHLARASSCGIEIELSSLPVADALTALCDPVSARSLALSGGDDYELCFSVAESRRNEIEKLRAEGFAMTRVGTVLAEPMLRVIDEDGAPLSVKRRGYRHFDD